MIEEILALLSDTEKRTGLVVFASYDSYQVWLVQHCITITKAQCHYRSVYMYWQHEQTGNKLQLVIIAKDDDLHRLAGQLFDKIWFADVLTPRRRSAVRTRERKHFMVANVIVE